MGQSTSRRVNQRRAKRDRARTQAPEPPAPPAIEDRKAPRLDKGKGKGKGKVKGKYTHTRQGKEICFSWTRKSDGSKGAGNEFGPGGKECPKGRAHACEWCLSTAHKCADCLDR